MAAAKVQGVEVSANCDSGIESLSSVGRLMAERTTQSWTTVPHFFLSRDVDASGLVETRQKLASDTGQTGGVKPTVTDLLIFFVAHTLVKHPHLNASWANDGIRYNQSVNVGVAIAVSEGVVVGVIQNADKTTLGAISAMRRDLSDRARTG